jgi:hypothetical protein
VKPRSRATAAASSGSVAAGPTSDGRHGGEPADASVSDSANPLWTRAAAAAGEGGRAAIPVSAAAGSGVLARARTRRSRIAVEYFAAAVGAAWRAAEPGRGRSAARHAENIKSSCFQFFELSGASRAVRVAASPSELARPICAAIPEVFADQSAGRGCLTGRARRVRS